MEFVAIDTAKKYDASLRIWSDARQSWGEDLLAYFEDDLSTHIFAEPGTAIMTQRQIDEMIEFYKEEVDQANAGDQGDVLERVEEGERYDLDVIQDGSVSDEDMADYREVVAESMTKRRTSGGYISAELAAIEHAAQR